MNQTTHPCPPHRECSHRVGLDTELLHEGAHGGVRGRGLAQLQNTSFRTQKKSRREERKGLQCANNESRGGVVDEYSHSARSG